MSEAILGNPVGLYAAPELRWTPSRPDRSAIDLALASTGDWLARLLSASYGRLARFLGDGAKTVHAGAAAIPLAFRRLRQHASALQAASRGGLEDALRGESRTYADLIAAGLPRRSGFALPFRSRPNPYASFGVMARVEAIAAFSQAAVAKREKAAPSPATPVVVDSAAWTGGRRGVPDVRTEARKLRLAATGVATGVLMSLRLAGDSLVAKAARVRRFLADGARTVHVGAYDGLARIQTSPHFRLAASVAGIAGLAALGLSHDALPWFEHVSATDLVSAAGNPAPEPVAQVTASEFIHTGTSEMTATTSLSVGKDAATSAFREMLSGLGSALGGSDAGSDIVRVAEQQAAESVQSAFVADEAGTEAAPSMPVPGHKPSDAAMHETVMSAADRLNSMQLRLATGEGVGNPAPSPDFVDAVRDTLGLGVGGPDNVESILHSQVFHADVCRELVGDEGACTIQVVAPEHGTLTIDGANGVYTLTDPDGNVLARQGGPTEIEIQPRSPNR